jgi:TolA-binding protein
MKPFFPATTLLLALAIGCALPGAAAAAGPRYKQADQKFPPTPNEFDDDIERGFLQNIVTHHQAGAMAATSGAMDQARAEWGTEAQAMAEFADKFPSSDWSISFRFNAAKYFFYARKDDRAAEQADKLLLDKRANDTSRAMAAKLAFAAMNTVAMGSVKAGTLEPLRLALWEQRRTVPLNPRPAPREWRMVVEYADTYVKLAESDPDMKKAPKERFLSIGPGQVALSAAQIDYAFDNMEAAQGRFARLIETWPAEAETPMVATYLSTFSALKDQAGLEAALPKVKSQVSAAMAKASDAATKEALAKTLEQLTLLEVDNAYNRAMQLLDGGQFAESAAAFEAFAAANPTNPNVSLALFNGAIAWDKANQGDKAAALREQVLARFPASKEAENAMPVLAAYRSKHGKKDEAVALYRDFIDKFPDSANRCNAAYNIGATLDEAGKPVDAARAYVKFASEPRCARADPNAAAKLLYRAAENFEKAGKMPEARKAYQACTEVTGVTDVVAKSNLAEARKRAKR